MADIYVPIYRYGYRQKYRTGTYEAKRHGPAHGLQAGSLVTFCRPFLSLRFKPKMHIFGCRPVLSLRFKPALRAGRHHVQAAPPFGVDALQGEEPGYEDLSVRPSQPDRRLDSL